MNSGEIRDEQTAKNFYEQLKELKTRINVAAMERRELESLKGSVYSPVYGDQVKRYPNSVALVERIDGMIEGISKKIYQYLELKTEARYIISKVPGAPEREVLILYYIIGLTHEEIADQLHYSLRHIERLHKKGLRMSVDVVESIPCV